MLFRSMPLVRDQVNLLLSAVIKFWSRLAPDQVTHLLADLVRLDSKPNIEQNPLLAGVIERIRNAAWEAVRPLGFLDAWQRQFQLALSSAALRFTSFTNLGAETRWWFFRLAAHAGAAYLRTEGLPGPDREPLLVTSPFIDAAAQPQVVSRPGTPLALRGMVVGGWPPGPIGTEAGLDHG